MEKKVIRVVAAFLTDGDKIFVAKRDYGEFEGLWEFPGGKIEQGETPEQAIVREIKEELNTDVIVDSFLLNEKYKYPTFFLDMDVFKCHIDHGNLNATKGIHSEDGWFKIADLFNLQMCPADSEIVRTLINKKLCN